MLVHAAARRARRRRGPHATAPQTATPAPAGFSARERAVLLRDQRRVLLPGRVAQERAEAAMRCRVDVWQEVTWHFGLDGMRRAWKRAFHRSY